MVDFTQLCFSANVLEYYDGIRIGLLRSLQTDCFDQQLGVKKNYTKV